MTFGEKLKLLRFEKGMTQDDLGYILNVTKLSEKDIKSIFFTK